MSVTAINSTSGADLVNPLVQNVGQNATPDLSAGVNVLKKALSLTQNNTAELLASEGDGSKSGSRLNVYG